MGVLQTLMSAPGTWTGQGVNHEQERFAGALVVEPLVGGAAVLLRYKAVLEDGSVAHEECTLLAIGPDGRPCLWPVMSELPVVLPHAEVLAEDGRSVFASGPRDDASAFREEITIAFGADGRLTYAHAWGLPGGEFAERSYCHLVR